jgi:predicted PurR-regulated permease PerM
VVDATGAHAGAPGAPFAADAAVESPVTAEPSAAAASAVPSAPAGAPGANAASSAVTIAARLVIFAIVCGALYWGQVVLVPLALAVLLTFVLTPPVMRLQRIGLPRIASVIVVVTLVLVALSGLGWVVAGELSALAQQLPSYRANIRERVSDIRHLTRGGAIEKVQDTIEDISKDIERETAAEQPKVGDDAPMLVEVTPNRTLIGDVERFLPLVESATTGGLALLLAILMLIQREDVRNRIVGLAGQAALVTTTKAFAEAGQRISRYLLMQFIINATMGVAVGVGLYFIGVPYSVLWGLAAAVLRYIPYVGPWIAALFPITVSLVTAPDWTHVTLVIGLFVVLELLSNNLMEPWLYGQSVGLSPIAVILAVIFWTWLWGAVGLVLATPLTVCLVVTGKYISGLAVFDRLLGDGSALEPHLWLYQRLLARDEGEAWDVLEEYSSEHTVEQTCEQLLLPALLVLKRDLVRGRVSAAEGKFVADELLEIIEELSKSERPPTPVGAPVLLIGLPAEDRLDEIALRLLEVLLRKEPRCELAILSADHLVSERLAEIEARSPSAVCVASLPPGDLGATRLLCKRLKSRQPELPIVAGRLGPSSAPERARRVLAEAGVEHFARSLEDFRAAAATVVRAVVSAMPLTDQTVADTA